MNVRKWLFLRERVDIVVCVSNAGDDSARSEGPPERPAGDQPLLADQRQTWIAAEVARRGGVRVSDVVTALGVSEMTIRRDIAQLADHGRIVRVHGGAVPVSHSAEEPAFEAKSELHPARKAAIAARAAEWVRPGSSIALSGGTTTLEVARALRGTPGLTVVTNSLPAADVLHDGGSTVILTGGERTVSNALVGPVAVRAIEGLHVDWLFLGVHGIDERAGFTTPNLREAETSRALIRSAGSVVVVADSSKWGVIGLRTIAALADVDALITDDGLDPYARAILEDTVPNLEVVQP
jgi:DeoR/GlpR family transcriptional regulator of sugar metabolism